MSDPARASRLGPTSWASLGGVVAVGLSVASAELIAALGSWAGILDANASPITALGATFISLTPEWLKEFAITTFGEHDKDALRVGMALVLILAGIVLGIVARRRPRLSTGLFSAGVAVTIVAILTRPHAGVTAAIPVLVGGVLGASLLLLVVPRLSPASPPPSGPSRLPVDSGPSTTHEAPLPGATTTDRRTALRLLGIGAAAAAGSGALATVVPDTARVRANRAALTLPRAVNARPVPRVGLHVPGLTPFITPNEHFYRVDTAFVIPQVTTADWSLRVHGMVEKPFDIRFADLIRMPLTEHMMTMTCVSNPVGGNLTGNATWLGAHLRDLLERARPTAGADAVLSTSADGFTIVTPLSALTDDRNALLALGMNGEPLPPAHGFPVRMVVPGLYGYVSATKWVVDLKVTRFAVDTGYWTTRGWSAHGPVKISSRIDVPRVSDTLESGRITIAGVAWAQHHGISAVEVQIDDGPWEPATLSAPVNLDTWRQWRHDWDAGPGPHGIRCRAIDQAGRIQSGLVTDVAPDGATGYHSLSVTVR